MKKSEVASERKKTKAKKDTSVINREDSLKYLVPCLLSLVFFLLIVEPVCPESDEALYIDQQGNVGIGTRHPEKKLHINGIVKAMGFEGDGAVPKNIIVMWSGSLEDIPPGWALCDGKPPTPNLTDKFILGVAESENPGETGGGKSHSHKIDDHVHPFSGTTKKHEAGGRSGVGPRILTYAHDHKFSGKTGKSSLNIHDEDHLPPYYKLAFIMYIGK